MVGRCHHAGLSQRTGWAHIRWWCSVRGSVIAAQVVTCQAVRVLAVSHWLPAGTLVAAGCAVDSAGIGAQGGRGACGSAQTGSGPSGSRWNGGGCAHAASWQHRWWQQAEPWLLMARCHIGWQRHGWWYAGWSGAGGGAQAGGGAGGSWQGHSGCGDGASGLAACRRSMALAVERRLAASVVVVVAPAGRDAGGSRWRAGGSYGPALPCVAAAQVVVGRPAAAQVALYGVVVAVVTMAAAQVATSLVMVLTRGCHANWQPHRWCRWWHGWQRAGWWRRWSSWWCRLAGWLAAAQVVAGLATTLMVAVVISAAPM
jgi:hypothetical protein